MTHKPEWWDGWRAYQDGKPHTANPHTCFFTGYEPRTLWRAGWFSAWGQEVITNLQEPSR